MMMMSVSGVASRSATQITEEDNCNISSVSFSEKRTSYRG